MCLLLFHPVVYKKLVTVNTVSVNITNLLITLQVPDDPANSNKSLYTCAFQFVFKD